MKYRIQRKQPWLNGRWKWVGYEMLNLNSDLEAMEALLEVAKEAEILANDLVATKFENINEENISLRSSNLDLKLELSDAQRECSILERERDCLKDENAELEGRIRGFEADMKGMESALLQVRAELSAALEDREMYRQRAETVAAS